LIALPEKKDAFGQIYNIGNNEEVSIKELAERIKSRLNSSSEIVHIPYEKAYGKGFEEMLRRVPDTTKINSLIGWKPTTSLNEIINKTADWFRQQEG
jgi:UDP-glucose 4-epimerase